jgi:NitT/TauT family transport system permease protein
MADKQIKNKELLSIRENLNKRVRIILGIIPIVLLFFTWYFTTNGIAEDRIISPTILPSPLEVVKDIKVIWFDAELSRSIVASTSRVLWGFVIGTLIAFPLSIFMGTFTKIKAMFEPGTVFLAYLPIPALIPLTMSIFGIGELQKIMFLALAFLIYLIPLFVKALDEVDNVYLQTAYTLGVKRWKMLRSVLLPIALPQIVQAMRMGFGVGWTYIILVEMVASDRGLGSIITIAQRVGPREHIYLVLIVIVTIAYLTDKLWSFLYDQLFPYKRAR